MPHKYTTQIEEKMAKAVGVSLELSSKTAIDVCRHLKHKKLQRAKVILEEVQKLKTAIPSRRTQGSGHRRGGMGPGRYPVNAAKEILKLLNSVETNARFKGLNENDLVITTLVSNESAKQWHYGRFRRRRHKRTTIEIIVTEIQEKKTEVKKEATQKHRNSEGISSSRNAKHFSEPKVSDAASKPTVQEAPKAKAPEKPKEAEIKKVTQKPTVSGTAKAESEAEVKKSEPKKAEPEVKKE